MAEAADIGHAGVEIGIFSRCGKQRIVAAIELAHGVTPAPIGGGASRTFNPGVLVRRNSLSGELTANPIQFFGHDDLSPETGGGKRTGYSTKPPSNDQHIGLQFLHGW